MANISDIDKQIAELQAQKKKLVEDEKKTSLQKVNLALQELNALGFNYSLSEGTTSTRTRRTGVRQEVLDVIKAADEAISRADILDKLEATTSSAKQSISNALSNLKKAGKIDSDKGQYRPLD